MDKFEKSILELTNIMIDSVEDYLEAFPGSKVVREAGKSKIVIPTEDKKVYVISINTNVVE
jgi:hypothetical protein